MVDGELAPLRGSTGSSRPIPAPGYREDLRRGRCPAPVKFVAKYTHRGQRRIGSSVMRILHTMIRVANLDASKRFYCESLGMKVLRKREYPDGKFTLCFLGYGSEEGTCAIELTYTAMREGTWRSARTTSRGPWTACARGGTRAQPRRLARSVRGSP